MKRFCAALSAVMILYAPPAWAMQESLNQKAGDVILSLSNASIVKTVSGVSASFSPREEVLIVTDKGNTMIYEPATWQEIKSISGHAYCFSPNRDMMAVNGTRLLTFFNVATKQAVKVWGGSYISIDADCRMASITNYTDVTLDAVVTVLDTSTGEIIKKVDGWQGKFSPDGKVMAMNRYAPSLFGSANKVLLYDTSTWQLIDSFDDFFEGFGAYGKTLITSYTSGQNKQYHDISAWAGNRSGESDDRARPGKQPQQMKSSGNWQLVIDEKRQIVTVYDARMLSAKNSFRKGEFESTGEYEERMSKWGQDYVSLLVLGRYDADKNGYESSLAGKSVLIRVPRGKAKEMQGHKNKIHAEGKLKYYDSENARLTDAALVDDVTHERFAIHGTTTAPAFARIHTPIVVKSKAGDIDAVPDFKTAPRPNDIAIVIGIENYQGVPTSEHSGSDAALVKEYLKALGFQERNIDLIVNERATKSRIETAIEGWLPNRAKRDSRIIVYYSGHGAPEPTTGEAYIVPFDGDPNYLATSGYSLKRLYEKLGAVRTVETIVLLDSCFSGTGGRSVLARGARPLVVVKEASPASRNMAVLSAAHGTQISTSSPERGHGLFTYYFLKALKDGMKSLADIYEYMKPQVEDEAKQLNIQQSPSLNPSPEKMAGRFILRK
jgi:hypothetical protein